MKVFSVRLEDDLHEELRVLSFESNKSMNEIIVEALEDKLRKDDKNDYS